MGEMIETETEEARQARTSTRKMQPELIDALLEAMREQAQEEKVDD